MNFVLVVMIASSFLGQNQLFAELNMPREAAPLLEQPAFSKAYSVSRRANPFYLRGDFDGDGHPDYAILIKEKRKNGGNGIVICHPSLNRIFILGAGKPHALVDSDGYQYKDLHFDAWRVYEFRTVDEVPEEGPPPQLKGEAIIVLWAEAGGGLIYWNGAGYSWYHLGG